MEYCGLGDWRLLGKTIDEAETIILAYIGFEIGVSGMNPYSIKKTYIYAIEAFFTTNRIRNEFGQAIRRGGIVQFMLKGYLRIYHLMHPKSEFKKIAFTIELVKYVNEAVKREKPEWLNQNFKVVFLKFALKFGIYFLLRKSEYLPDGKGRSGIKWKNMTFYTTGGLKISFEDLNRDSLIQSIEINIERSKTDQFGLGRLVRHTKVEGDCCIVSEIFSMAIFAKENWNVPSECGMLQMPNGTSLVDEDEITFAMKAVARCLGWKEDKLSAHSLRYGGATLLAAAGLPQYVIAYFGGWTEDSESLRQYTQLGSEAVKAVSEIMSRGFDRSLEESRIRFSSMAN